MVGLLKTARAQRRGTADENDSNATHLEDCGAVRTGLLSFRALLYKISKQ